MTASISKTGNCRFLTAAALLMVLSILSANSAYAGLSEQVKLLASDGDVNDFFGWSVSVSGDYAIVGARGDDDNGIWSGSAYIFYFDGTSWSEQAKLLASDGDVGDDFGSSVTISGDYAIVGAYADNDNGRTSGSAYIFKRYGTNWSQQAKLLAPDGAEGDRFGHSVSISGDYAIVGAYADNDNGRTSGSAYIFKRYGTNWSQQAKLLASDGAAEDAFGVAVSLSSDYAIVGACWPDDNLSTRMVPGEVYIFKRYGTSWSEQGKLLQGDGAADDRFGHSVSLSGDYAIIGARKDDDKGLWSGSAYIFYNDGTSWSKQAKLLAADGAAYDNFGESVSLSGDYAIVGAGLDDDSGSHSGSAYIFYNNGTSWTQQAKLTASDGAAKDRFGKSVSISDNHAIVGACLDDDSGDRSGSAYIYPSFPEIHGTKWYETDGDFVKGIDEYPIEGWRIYIDVDENGHFDAGEPSDLTDADGNYVLAAPGAGTWLVAEEVGPCWEQVYPGGDGTHSVSLETSEIATGYNFGNALLTFEYGGGSGSVADPYLISDKNHIQSLSLPCHWNKHFKLIADLDLTGLAMTPIGDYNTPFTGTFDGNGFALANLTINLPASDHVGLFGYVDNAIDPNTIFNLNLVNPVITGNYYVAALAGRLTNATLSGCYVDGGSVNGGTYVGGLVGYNLSSGTISNCCATGQVNGTSSVGGLVGYTRYDTISYCYAAGTITGTSLIGGLVGENFGSTISNCYATGAVVGSTYAGGLVGNSSTASCTISNCYATGLVDGTRYVGGLVGWKNGIVTNCYSTGQVNGSMDVGGLLGWNNGATSNSFWDTQTSGQLTSAGGMGKTTAQMMTIITFDDAGWDFLGETANGTEDIWWMCGGGVDSPQLTAQEPHIHYGGGSGSIADPYLISHKRHLHTLSLARCHWSKHFKLTADLDLTAINLTPIGTVAVPFTGTFDGNGFTLANLTINLPASYYVGLFGYVDNPIDPNTVFNLGLIDPNITGDQNVGALAGKLIDGSLSGCYANGGSVNGAKYLGGLAGYNDSGTISKCYATGQLNGGGSYFGGLAGYNYSGTISNSYATGHVNGADYLGGLMGGNYSGTISNCCATGSVTGTNAVVGGLVGLNRSGTISYCYSTGGVVGVGYLGGLVGNNLSGTVTNSFWDTQTSGQPTSAGGTGMITVQMQTRDIFLDAGWDFAGESGNGGKDIWRMCLDEVEYPRLSWDFVVGDYLCPDGVNLVDYSLFASHWGEDNCGASNDCGGADLDHSGKVDMNDLIIFIDSMMKGD